MKNRFFLFAAGMLFLYASHAQVFRGSDAQKYYPGADMVRVKSQHALPDYIRLQPDAYFAVDKLESRMTEALGLDDMMGFQLVRIQRDGTDQQHLRYKMHFGAVPVFDADVVVHVKNGLVHSMNGMLYRDLNIGNQAVMDESVARETALARFPAERYKWEMPEEEALLKYIKSDPQATYYPAGKLVLYPVRTGEILVHRYAWVFDIYADKPLKKAELFIDAETGDILFSHDRIHVSDAPGTAVTKYSGTQEIVSDSFEGIYRLREAGRGNGIETYNMQEGTSYGNAVDFTDADNYWDNFNAQFDEVAGDAHWATEMTYDYYWVNYNRNSIDDQGFKLLSYVHYDQGYANAFWDGTRMTYGDGDGNWSPLTAVDICAHEITHGLTEFTAGLIYSYESGALNEAYSDIFGTAVEFFAKPATANWLMGEDIGSPLRNLANPNAMGDPDTYLGNNWYTGSGDNGGVHTNSNVLNYWFYLCSVGGSGVNDNGDAYNVTGITIEKAGAISYRTLVNYLVPGSQYDDARFYTILATTDLYGGCSPEVETVTNAFYAIGVGDPYDPTVTAVFDALTTSFCSLPATVAFSNTSNNGINYLWNFGDGTTSTLFAPTHNYAGEGVYTVTLAVDGGPCGTDTEVKTDFIVIDAPDSPVVTSASNCGGPASLTLTATAPDSVRWYTTPTGGTAFFTGTSYTTPVLSQTEHYYVENEVYTPEIFGGKPNNTGGGNYFTNNAVHYLIFNALTPIVIKSVKVYAQNAGVRVVSLRNSSGTVLISKNINIVAGESRIDLDFEVPVGNGFQLAGPPNPGLYRNNGGCAYPYNIGNMAVILESSAGTNPTGYYYFFYDWEVQEQPCTSERLKVSAFINYGDPLASFTYSAFPFLVQFQNTSTDGNDFSWDFGDGNTSTEENPLHQYAAPGLYNVTLLVTNSCGSHSVSQSVNVLATGISSGQIPANVILSPVPANDVLKLKFTGTSMHQLSFSITDLLGKQYLPVFIGDADAGASVQLDVSSLKAGVYTLDIRHSEGRISRRFIVY